MTDARRLDVGMPATPGMAGALERLTAGIEAPEKRRQEQERTARRAAALRTLGEATLRLSPADLERLRSKSDDVAKALDAL